MNASENARGEHRRRKARAFLIREICHHDGVFCLDAEIVEGTNNLEPTEDTQNTVVFSTRWLRVAVASNINWKRAGIRV